MNIKDIEAELLIIKYKLHQALRIDALQEIRIVELTKENTKFLFEIKSLQAQLIKI